MCRVNDLLKQEIPKQGRFTLASVDKIALLLVCPFFEFNECYGKIVTYTPTSKEIKRKRGRGYGSRGRKKDERRGEGDDESERGEKGENFHLREYTCCYTLGRSCAPPGEGTAFLRRLTRCARPGQTEGRRLLLLERNARRVATIPLCISFGRPL